MMGASHAASGVAGWVALCAAGSLAGVDVEPSTVLVGAGVAAGFALLPDLDHPGSTISRSLGPVTGVLARVTSFAADKVQDWTCPCCKDPDTVAHRALTHTAVGAVVTGGLVALAGARLGKPAALVVVFLALALAVRGMVPTKWRGTLGAVLAGAGAAALVFAFGPDAGWWWLGLPAGFGVLAHIVGDGLTKSAVPLLWPVRISGCRWYPCGPPRWLRFRTGGGVERWVVGPLMLAALAGSCWVLAGMPS
jgi:membrane-bound metal-dependent hydrolase YbcI (DUF457 family)